MVLNGTKYVKNRHKQSNEQYHTIDGKNWSRKQFHSVKMYVWCLMELNETKYVKTPDKNLESSIKPLMIRIDPGNNFTL